MQNVSKVSILRLCTIKASIWHLFYWGLAQTAKQGCFLQNFQETEGFVKTFLRENKKSQEFENFLRICQFWHVGFCYVAAEKAAVTFLPLARGASGWKWSKKLFFLVLGQFRVKITFLHFWRPIAKTVLGVKEYSYFWMPNTTFGSKSAFLQKNTPFEQEVAFLHPMQKKRVGMVLEPFGLCFAHSDPKN